MAPMNGSALEKALSSRKHPIVSLSTLLVSVSVCLVTDCSKSTDLRSHGGQAPPPGVPAAVPKTTSPGSNEPLLPALSTSPAALWLRRPWDQVPRPTDHGTNALDSVTSFVASNGWNMCSDTLYFFQIRKKCKPIAGLPWKEIRDRMARS